MHSHTDIIKEKLNILDVVGSYVKLEKAGKTWKGKSPFNNEKTPSFFVNPEKGFFYCFSSGKGGDIFTFVQEIERIEFPDALKMLAERAGVNLGTISFQDQTVEKKLFQLLDDATKWYEIHLRKNKDAVEYLLQRGLKKETIIQFRLGFAQDSWTDIYDYLKHKKYTDVEIEQAGLITKKDSAGKGYYDRFRSRIMFPLFDGRGRIVGFSGRIFGNDENTAKYINSPEGPLFDKSQVLYGYHTAKSAISKQGFCILVEGQFDVLMSQQVGYENTVAISGTGLTVEHIKKIKRFTDTLVLALDSDNAGIKATRRSVIRAYEQGMNVKVVPLDPGQDPADTIQQSESAWSVALADAQHYVDFRMLVFNRTEHTLDEKNDLVQKDLFEFISLINSAVVQDAFLQKISLFLGVSIEAVRTDFASYKPHEIHISAANSDLMKHSSDNKNILSPHDELLYIVAYMNENNMLIEPAFLKLYREHFGTDIDITTLDIEKINMYNFVFEQKFMHKQDFMIHRTLQDLLSQIQEKDIVKELYEIDVMIKQEQLQNPNQVTEHLKDLMKKSTILLSKKNDLQTINHKAS